MYSWRCGLPGSSPFCPPEYHQKTTASQAALIRETDFAFKQAFAFCPYSPEAVFRYVNFLLGLAQTEEMNGHPEKAGHYFDDAILVGETCQKLDPFNEQVAGLINSVKGYKNSIADRLQAVNQVDSMEAMARTNPANVQNLVILGSAYIQMQQSNRAAQLFDQALARPEINMGEAQAVAQYLAQMGNFPKLETAIKKMVSLAPDQPEPRLNLAALESITGRSKEALADLKLALDLGAKHQAADPKSPDLVESVRKDPRFGPLHNLPEYQKLVPPTSLEKK
jgi:tetratricopeptide (TPR) repeat protein